MLPVCGEWSDAVWSLARSWLEVEVDQRVLGPFDSADRDLDVRPLPLRLPDGHVNLRVVGMVMSICELG
jgi:hypothetical protein